MNTDDRKDKPEASACGRPTVQPQTERREWWLLAILVVATLVVYEPVRRAGFVWDDDVLLTGNRHVQSAAGLWTIWFGMESPDYFPMTSTLLWLQWRLWGAEPLGYHVVNVLFHLLSSVLWWRLLERLRIPGAWLAAAIFALHPVNVESVAWISEHKNTVAMVFLVLTLLAYVQFEDTGRQRWYWAAFGGFLLALLSKTAAAPLPVVLLGLAAWRRGKIERRDLWRTAPFFAAAALLAVVTLWFHHHKAIAGVAIRTDGFGARLAGAGWAFWFYLYKTVWPANLVFVYPRWVVDGASVLSYVPGVLAAAGFGACWWKRAQRGRAWLFALGFFVAMLTPVLGFLTISFMRYSYVADRWQYFAIMGPIALFAAGASRFKLPMLVRIGGAAALLVTLGSLTWRQSGMYHDLQTLWETTLRRNPNCAVAHNDLGHLLAQQGRTDEAIVHLENALALEPEDELTHYNLGYVLLQKDRVDEAVGHFEKCVALDRSSVEAHFQLGNARLRQGRADEALACFRKTVELGPEFAEGRFRLGDLLLQQGRVDEAVEQLRAALRVQPAYFDACTSLGIALFQSGRPEEALENFRRAVELQPAMAEAQINLGKALLQVGRAGEAVPFFRAALKLQPNDAPLLSELAWVLATSKDDAVRNGAEAVQLAQRAKELTGGRDPWVLRSLAAAFAEVGRFGEARGMMEDVLKRPEVRGDVGLTGELQNDLQFYAAGVAKRQ